MQLHNVRAAAILLCGSQGRDVAVSTALGTAGPWGDAAWEFSPGFRLPLFQITAKQCRCENLGETAAVLCLVAQGRGYSHMN